MSNLKPVIPLTEAQRIEYIELNQKKSAIGKVIADAQTEFAAAQLIYSVAMDKFKAENDPALRVAQSKFDAINNDMRFELAAIEESLRNIRIVELLEK